MTDEKKKLISFVRENSGLFTSIGVFAALTVYFNQFIQSSDGLSSISLKFGSIAIYLILIFLSFALIADAKERSWIVKIFCILILVILICLGIYTYTKFIEQFLLIFKICLILGGILFGASLGFLSIFDYLQSSRNKFSIGETTAITGIPFPVILFIAIFSLMPLMESGNFYSTPFLFALAASAAFFLIAFVFFIFKALPDFIQFRRKIKNETQTISKV